MTGKLFLVRANKSRGGGYWDADDFDVRLDNASGQVIGRIFRSPQSPQDRPWFWTISRFPQKPTERGYARTREDAMAAFRLAWDGAADPEGPREWTKTIYNFIRTERKLSRRRRWQEYSEMGIGDRFIHGIKSKLVHSVILVIVIGSIVLTVVRVRHMLGL